MPRTRANTFTQENCHMKIACVDAALVSSRFDRSCDVCSGTRTSGVLSSHLKTSRFLRSRSTKLPERCVAARCVNVKDPKKGISLHRIPFYEETSEIKRKWCKKWKTNPLRTKWPLKYKSSSVVHFGLILESGS